jgi:hypothetical protein
MSTPGLSAVASWVARSLHEHPELRLPEAIAIGPESDGSDVPAVREALAELQHRGLAKQDDDGGWQLTERGRQSAAYT